MHKKLIKASSTENFVCRLVSEDGEIEMGIYPVLFGFRVRAGYVGSMCCEIDWCCGDNQRMLEVAYSVAKKLLESGNNFKGIPPSSNVKPFFKDRKFNEWLLFNLSDEDVIEPLPPMHQIKEEYWQFIRTIGAINNGT